MHQRFPYEIKLALLFFVVLISASQAQAGTPQTITFPSIGIQSSAKPSFTLNATASSGLPVTYTIVGGGSLASVTGSTVTLTGTTGAVTVEASQAGNGIYNAAPNVYGTFTVTTSAQAAPWKSISAGTFAVRSDGTLWAWGNNDIGQLGDGTTTTRSTPEQIGTATNWQFISSYQGESTEAIRSDGTLWAWGDNYYGELGDGTETTRTSPVQIGTATNWKTVAAGFSETVAIKTDGTLWDWGNYNNLSPTQVGTGTNWQSVSASYSHVMAIKADGTLWGWGDNEYGESGGGSTPAKMGQIGTGTNWKSVSAGQYYTVAIKTDGTLWAWGINNQYQLGNGGSATENNPVQIGTATNWQSISAGEVDTVALQTNGTLWAWGDNQLGELGDGTITPRNSPEQIGTSTNWQIASEGGFFTVAVQADGSLWTWGNVSDQLGYLNTGLRPVSVSLGSLASFAAGNAHAVAVLTNGTLWAWGSNSNGQLGDGTTTQQKSPEQIGMATNWMSVSAGKSSTLALKTDGTLWAWGANNNGQLGDGTTTQDSSPEQIGTSTNWQSVSEGAGYYSTTTMAVKTDGTLWAWGANNHGQLGDGTTTQHNSPEQVGTAPIGNPFLLAKATPLG